MFKMCRKAGVDVILSYADPNAGHTGVIYRATGFQCMGKTGARQDILWKGKVYPRRNLRQLDRAYHVDLNAALESGEAQRVTSPGKIIYIKDLR